MDDIDRANDMAEQHRERSIAAARQPIPPGKPGECEACLDDSPRLVITAGLMICPPCRDKREKRR